MNKIYSKCHGVEVVYSEIQNPEGWFDRGEVPYVIPICPKCGAKPCKTMTEQEWRNAKEQAPQPADDVKFQDADKDGEGEGR